MIDDPDDDHSMALLREQMLEAVLDQLAQGHELLAIAATLNTISLSMYRTVLSDSEYHEITDVIYEHRDLITSLEPLAQRRLH